MLLLLSTVLAVLFSPTLSQPWIHRFEPTPDNKNYTGTFLIVAPKVIRHGIPYAVSVSVFTTAAVDVDLSIRDSKNTSVSTAKATAVTAGKPATAKFDAIPATLSTEESYRLVARGVSANGVEIFQSEGPVRFDQKSLSIFVQTDKAIYKPGATVHYRVIVVNPDLKPFKGSVGLKITDPNSNVIAQSDKEKLVTGVVNKDLSLSDEPPLGDWIIEVTVDSAKTTKSFTVDKYVLPKFEVKVVTPPFVTIHDDIPVTIRARYTYNKGVPGTVVVRTQSQYQWRPAPCLSNGGGPCIGGGSSVEVPGILHTEKMDDSGEVIVRFKNSELKEHNLITDYGYNTITFTATVTEGLTGIERNGTGSVTAHKYATKVVLTKPNDNYKPGLDYTVKVAVVTQDDKSYDKAANKLMFIKYTTFFPYTVNGTRSPVENTTTISLDQDGTAAYTVKPPQDAENIQIAASYEKADSEITDTLYVQPAKSPSKNFIQLIAKTGKVAVGDDIIYTLKATERVTKITWQVMSKGYVLKSEQKVIESRETEIKLKATADMAPKSRLIVYAIRPENKEILVDAIDINVDGLFRNNVSISMNKDKAEPNQTVEFRVKADPKSFVGLLAVDQSVQLLKTGNDITQDLVEADISSYDTTGQSGGYPFWRRGGRREKRSFWPWWGWGVNGKDPATIFENSGVLVLTDAYLYSEPIPPIYMPNLEMFDGGPMPVFSMAVPDSMPLATSTAERRRSPIVIRTLFPETWIWTDVVVGANGEAVHKAVVPDTITSWITSAFAINDDSGLGVAPEPAKLQVFRPFFIRLNLPYSVKRGEKLALQVLIFNYQEHDEKVTVTLDFDEHSGYKFVNKDGSENNLKPSKDKRLDVNSRLINVRKGGSAAVYFPIIPTIVGDLKLLVKAVGTTAADGVEQPLIVEAEGVPLYFNKPIIVDLSNTSTFSTKVRLDPPQANVIEGSDRVEFSAIGDIMGPILQNIEELIRMPYGCGEQNMLNFVPNIVVSRYLNATGRLKPELKVKTENYMKEGYQRELTYKRDDNSFSAFGKSDKAGSTWLSAFVFRSFKQAEGLIYVDQTVLENIGKFLKLQQNEAGEFVEHGEVHHKAMQGGASTGGVPLTAYVLSALLINKFPNTEAQTYIENKLDSIRNDAYALAVATYALHLAKSAKKDDFLAAVEHLAITKNGMKHWSQIVDDNVGKPKTWWYDAPRPVDVEMTSYVLLTYMLRNQVSDGLPIVRWLATQRNALGGFASTQDTVIGIQALGAYAEKAFNADSRIEMKIKQADLSYTSSINPQNAIILQTYKLKDMKTEVEVTATGNGIAFAQISWHYNVDKLNESKPFDCTKTVGQPSSAVVQLQLCCKYALEGKSNMVVTEIEAPSGYTVDSEELYKLAGKVPDLQRVELRKGDTQAAIYFNSLGSTPVCFNVTNNRAFTVADQKPSRIKVTDYYDPKLQVEMDYSPSNLARQTLSAQCEECWPADKPVNAAASQDGSGVSANRTGTNRLNAGSIGAVLLLLVHFMCGSL